MAKRNIRKTDPEIVTTPERREASAADPNGRAAAPKTSRSRRKADARRSRRDAIRTGDRGDPDYQPKARSRRPQRLRAQPATGSAPHGRVVVHDCR